MAPVNNSNPTSLTDFGDASIVVEAILTYLDQEHNVVDEEPLGLDEALARATEDPVEQALLQTGFLTWFAYHNVMRSASGSVVRAAVSRLSLLGLATIARIIEVWARRDESTCLLVNYIFHVSPRREWRTEMLRSIGVEVPLMCKQNKQKYKSLLCEHSQTSPPTPEEPERLLPAPSPSSHSVHIAPHPPLHDTDGRLIFPWQRVAQNRETEIISVTQPWCDIEPTKGWGDAWPLRKNLSNVFPSTLHRCIRTIGEQQAAVVISHLGPFWSELTMDIEADKVDTLVRLLFNTTFHASKQTRCVFMSEDGPGIWARNCNTLFAAPMDRVKQHLGGFICGLFEESEARQTEVRNGEKETSLVEMDVWNSTDSPARIRVIMDEEPMRRVQAKLFPRPTRNT